MIFIANWKMNGEKSHISGINKTIEFLKQSKNKIVLKKAKKMTPL